MDVIKYYEPNQIKQWLNESGLDIAQINIFLDIFKSWDNTDEDLSSFEYPFLSGSYTTEVRSINERYVIKATPYANIRTLQNKIDYYVNQMDISDDIFLPIYCLKLNNTHKFTNEFLNFQKTLYGRSTHNTPIFAKAFNCLIIQRKTFMLKELIEKARLSGEVHFDANIYNLGLLDDKLFLFDW